MSRLEQLIKELCPNGVEIVPLEELCTLITKQTGFDYSATIKPSLLQEKREDTYSFIQNKDFSGDNINLNTDFYIPIVIAKKFPKITIDTPSILISLSGKVGNLGYYDLKQIAFIGGAVAICKLKPGVNGKYIMYFLESSIGQKYLLGSVKAGSHLNITVEAIRKAPIYMPPLEVQNEIVKILDEYSASVYSLQQELEKELTARKKQYKYYLNRFFEENKGENKSLASLGTIQRGKRFVHADATDTGVPCIHYGELYTYYGVYTQKVKSHIREDLRDKMRYAKPNDVVIVGAGENKEDIGIGVAWYGNENVAVHDACYILSHDQNPKYISYFLRSDLYHQQIIKYVYEGKICSISAENIGKALIPLPSCDEQAKIVSVLDRLDKLCNDLTNNLPAEIEVRRKQYEYYRDKLLTFKEKA